MPSERTDNSPRWERHMKVIWESPEQHGLGSQVLSLCFARQLPTVPRVLLYMLVAPSTRPYQLGFILSGLGPKRMLV